MSHSLNPTDCRSVVRCLEKGDWVRHCADGGRRFWCRLLFL